MARKTHLCFDSHIGRLKPENIRNREASCPLCERDQLCEILAVDGSIIWLKNKFPVLQEAFQTVLIETDACDAELSEYDPAHLHRLFRFGVDRWREMIASGEYASVLFYKNHGPNSGGSLRHPHMQIVGLHHIDYRERLSEEYFEGLSIHEEGGVSFNLSTQPRMGFFEFNVLLHDMNALDRMADLVQMATHYLLNHFYYPCTSYNLFFYERGPGIAVKVVPRFVVSPLFVGFSIPQVSNRIEEVAEAIRCRYFEAP
jgi:ATP adenylyltransferase/5',5'''-P-1,P-4-tetraphosphate phosphorylase II